MELLNKDIREATKKRWEAELEGKVTLVYFTQEPSRLILPDTLAGQECLFCKETRQLLEEVSRLSSQVTLEVYDFKADRDKADALGIDKIPGLAILGAQDYGIRFYGIPSGYEYMSLIEAVIDVSRGRTSLRDKTKEALRSLPHTVHLQVFVTPTCPYCTACVRLAHQFALESSLIRADMVEATEFPHLSNKYHVMAVPKTVINDVSSFEGAVPEDAFLESVLRAVNLVKA